MGEKLDDLRTANGPRKQPKVEVPPRHPRHGRQRLPVEVILQHRRLSLRGPGATAVRAFAQSAFVDEDDGAARASVPSRCAADPRAVSELCAQRAPPSSALALHLASTVPPTDSPTADALPPAALPLPDVLLAATVGPPPAAAPPTSQSLAVLPPGFP